MELRNFAPRAGKGARGVLMLRFDTALDGAARIRARDVWIQRLGEVWKMPVDELPLRDPIGDAAPPAVLGLPWKPARPDRVDEQRAELERLAADLGASAAWCVQSVRNAGAKRRKLEADGRAPIPVWTPAHGALPFPVDGYPEIGDNLDWYDFGIALKLGGPPVAGERDAIDALHTLWMWAFTTFRHASIEFDAARRAVLLWVDRWSFPGDVVGHTLWLAARINEIIPVVHARFQEADINWKYRALTGDDSEPFILAGNPLAPVYAAGGYDAVTAWTADPPAGWSPDEIAAMLVELMETHEPGEPAEADAAIRLGDHALALAPGWAQTKSHIITALVHSGRTEAAIVRVGGWHEPWLVGHLIELVGEHAKDHLAAVLAGVPQLAGVTGMLARYRLDVESLDAETWAHICVVGRDDPPRMLDELRDKQLAALVVAVAKSAPELLTEFLELVPDRPDAAAHLYNAAFHVKAPPHSTDPRTGTPESLAIWERVARMTLPEPGSDREGYLWAHANAIINAYHLGDHERAVACIERAEPHGAAGPAIFVNAACVYTGGMRDVERGLEMVRKALDAGWADLEMLRTDDDLPLLHADPRFQALIAQAQQRLDAAPPSAGDRDLF